MFIIIAKEAIRIGMAYAAKKYVDNLLKQKGYQAGYKEGFLAEISKKRIFLECFKMGYESLKLIYNTEKRLLNFSIDLANGEIDSYISNIDSDINEFDELSASLKLNDNFYISGVKKIDIIDETLFFTASYNEGKEEGYQVGSNDAKRIFAQYISKIMREFNEINAKYQSLVDELEKLADESYQDMERRYNIRQVDLKNLRKSVSNYEMGEKYRLGRGVPRDLIAAEKFYTNSAKLGNVKAIQALEKYFF